MQRSSLVAYALLTQCSVMVISDKSSLGASGEKVLRQAGGKDARRVEGASEWMLVQLRSTCGLPTPLLTLLQGPRFPVSAL